MKPARSCPRCGTPLGDAADGLCLVCAGRLALETSAEETAANAPALGVRLGDYEILDELGRGAMGVVFRARQLSLKRVVALKVVLSGQFASEAERRRFLSEVEFAATLDHPNIVPVYEVGGAEGRPFCAMKLIDGQPLAQRIAPGSTRISEREAAALLARAARAVHHAHQRGIIHRDLKPANILVDAAGQPHITDFGLARRVGVDSSLSLTGSPLGTPAYMSPEQARGEKTITTAADIWSLGVMLYQLLTGRPPFEAENVPALLRKITEEEAPAFTTRGSRRKEAHASSPILEPSRGSQSLLTSAATIIDPDLATICLKCLEKDSARRYVSAADLADDLERWQRQEPILARRSTAQERALKWCARHPHRAMMFSLLLLVFLAGLSGIVWQWQRANRHASRADQRAEESRDRLLRLHVLNAQQRLETGDPVSALPWLAAALAEESPGSTRREVYRAALANIVRRSPGPEHIWWLPGADGNLALSPDGRHAIVADPTMDRVWFLNLANGDALELAGRKCSSAAFSPDGSFFALGGHNQSWLCSTESRAPIAPPLPQRSWVAQVGFSPNGRWLATLSRKTGVRLWDAATGEPPSHELAHPEVISFAFSPDSRRLVSSGQDQFVRLWEVPSGRLLAENRLAAWRCAFSPDGRRVVVGRGRARDALVLNAASLQPVFPPLPHDGYVEYVVVSADSQRVATGSRDGTARLWSLPTGQPLAPPLPLESECTALAFSADGEILATGSLDGRVRAWDARSGVPRSSWLHHAASVRGLVFTPGGQRLCSISADGTARVWRWNPSKPASITLPAPQGGIWNAHFFDQARRVVTRGPRGARIFDTTTGEAWTPLLEHNKGTRWADVSPDGSLLLTEGRDQRVRVWRIPGGELLGAWDCAAEIADARWLATAGRFVVLAENGELSIGMAASNAPLRLLTREMSAGNTLAVALDRRTFAVAFSNRKFGLWADEGGRHVLLDDCPAEVRKIRFSPDGTLLATGDKDGVIQFRRSLDGHPMGGLIRHADGVRDFAFSPDGGRLASLGADGMARVSRVPGGEPATVVIRPEPGATQLEWSADGRWLVVAGERSGQVWDARTGTSITPRVRYSIPVAGATFTPDGDQLLVLTGDGRLWRERLDAPDWPDDDWRFLARVFSSQEVDDTGSAVPRRAPSETNTQSAADTLTTRWRALRPRLERLAAPDR
jgi:WD40 repeat protein/serine/threonine protein kinase